MRHHFKFFTLLLAASMIPTGTAFAAYPNTSMTPHQSSVEQARDAAQWATLRDNKIEWSELQDLVHEYNPTVSSLWLDFRESQSRGKYNIDYEDVLDQIQKSYDASINAANSNEILEAYANLQYETSTAAQGVDTSAQATDEQAAELSIRQTEKTVTEQIRKSLISIYTTDLQRQMDQLTADHDASLYEMQKRKLGVGQATQLDVLTAQETMQNAQAKLSSDQALADKTKQLVLVNLGWKYNDSPEICEIPMVTEEMLSAMDLSKDTQTALANNFTILINERKIAVSSTDTQIGSLSTTVENEKESVRSDMIARFNSVKSAKNSLDQAKLSLSNAQAALDKVKRSYATGAASQRDLETAEYNTNVAKLAADIADYTLATEYYDYLAGRDGIATADAS